MHVCKPMWRKVLRRHFGCLASVLVGNKYLTFRLVSQRLTGDELDASKRSQQEPGTGSGQE